MIRADLDHIVVFTFQPTAGALKEKIKKFCLNNGGIFHEGGDLRFVDAQYQAVNIPQWRADAYFNAMRPHLKELSYKTEIANAIVERDKMELHCDIRNLGEGAL